MPIAIYSPIRECARTQKAGSHLDSRTKNSAAPVAREARSSVTSAKTISGGRASVAWRSSDLCSISWRGIRMTELYFTFEVAHTERRRKPTFQPRKALPVDFSLPIPPTM